MKFAKRIKLKCSHHTHKQNGNCAIMDIFLSLTGVIISQCICTLNTTLYSLNIYRCYFSNFKNKSNYSNYNHLSNNNSSKKYLPWRNAQSELITFLREIVRDQIGTERFTKKISFLRDLRSEGKLT